MTDFPFPVIDIPIPETVLTRWQNAVDIIADILDVPSALVTRVEPPMIEVLTSANTPGNPYNAGDKVAMANHYCEAVVTTAQPVAVTHAPTDEHWNAAPEIEYGMLAYLGLPLLWPGGEMFGTICILDNRENTFGQRYRRVLGEFCGLVESQLSLLSAMRELEDKNTKLEQALAEVHTLRGLLPICVYCKKIRDDSGYWNQVETYIEKRAQASFSHSICPDCARKHYPDMDLYEEHDTH